MAAVIYGAETMPADMKANRHISSASDQIQGSWFKWLHDFPARRFTPFSVNKTKYFVQPVAIKIDDNRPANIEGR